VTISRGRRGIRIFTPDKEQLRENVSRSGHRPLALELAPRLTPRRGVRLWDRLHGHSLRRIKNTMQRMELSFLAALPSSQIALVAEGQPVIHEIVVTEGEKQQARDSTADGNADKSGCDANCQHARNGGLLNPIERA